MNTKKRGKMKNRGPQKKKNTESSYYRLSLLRYLEIGPSASGEKTVQRL